MNRMASIIAVTLFTVLTHLSAQSAEELKEYFEEGQYFFNREEYADALFYYLKLVGADPQNANFNFKVGECYLNMEGSEHQAIPYFEKALSDIVPKNKYRRKSFEENSAPLHAYFYLGMAYRMNNQLNKALECYAKFIDSPFFYDNYNENVVDQEIQSCERAAIIRDAPVQHDMIRLGTEINTSSAEEKPVLSGDGNTLVFVRKLKFYDAIFCSRRLNGIWQTPVNINPQILSDGDYYPTGLSYDGNELLLVRRAGDGFDIYTAIFDGEVWTEARKMPGKLNSIFNETHASFGPDGNIILVTSDRKGGRGGFDIWYAEKNKQGEWGKLKNMGKQINTDQDEQVAYLCKEHDVLFFSSKGHYSMGGYDIFYTRRVGKRWKIPINLGFPINTTRDNLYYCPNPVSCREALFSLRTDDHPEDPDIYLIRITSERVLYFPVK